MGRYTKEDIFRIVEEEDVAFVRLKFCDVFGQPKNIAITVQELERALKGEVMIDGTPLKGFTCDGESDLYLYPDIDTFDIYPWRPQSGKVARMLCDLYTPDRKPFAADSRAILKRVLAEANQMGYRFRIDPEMEFFLFGCGDDGQPIPETDEKAGYLDLAPSDWGENVRRDIILNLEQMDFHITASHHEIAPAQHEIDFTAADAGRAADMVMTFKLAAKTIAKKHGLYATFMPKPLEGINGSGMHFSIRAETREGKNLFYDPSDKYGLSSDAYRFIAGILSHMEGITLITNPLINSYKRLIRGYDAPVNLTWSASSANRSALIRIPSPRGEATAIELRSPDGACNPYLAFALCIAAGLDGIEKGLEPPAELQGNMSEELQDQHFSMLPDTMGKAIEAFAKDPFVKEVLGEGIYQTFLCEKKKEWKAFRSFVTQWEMKAYLGKY